MSTLLVAIGSAIAFVVAYNTYGRYLSRRIFGLQTGEEMPSSAQRDDVDFVPTRRSVLLGHHFTSIAGTGPIVGPALAVFWGWLPALLWVVFGSILVGAVHDFAALVISIRNRGQTIGQAAGDLISPRAKVLFLVILTAALSIVLAVFGLVIATIFAIYPESVLSVWIAMPMAAWIGWRFVRGGGNLIAPCLIALGVLYVTVYLGAYHVPIDISGGEGLTSPVVLWTIALLAYAFIASVLPVWLLLQPRDFINSLQLVVALVLLVLGLAVAAFTGQADLMASAPAVASEIPADAPPILPFLFITIACGACSGFHCLVSSGTTSKQLESAPDAQMVGYGSMLGEGMLAVLVILACCAGVGMGRLERTTAKGTTTITREKGNIAPGTGLASWRSYYRTGLADPADGAGDSSGGWKKQNLGKKLAAFIDGGANFMSTLGMPLKLGVAVMAVMVACFAATTLDTATRLQRYVISELGASLHVPAVSNKYVATSIAVGTGLVIAIFAGDKPGAGGLILWPLFGATNQLLAGLALMVATFYLAKLSKPVAIVAFPMLLMMAMPAWAITYDLIHNWWPSRNVLLICFGVSVLGIQAWMAVEGILMWKRLKRLPPSDTNSGEDASSEIDTPEEAVVAVAE